MKLLEKHFEIALETPDGITRLRELILKFAMQGKLVAQNRNEKSASSLLEEIKLERTTLLKNKLIKRQDELLPIKTNEIPYEIPLSWKWCRLKNISYDLGQKKPDKNFTYIDVGSIDNKLGKISSNYQVLEAQDAPSRARKIVKKGTVIYSTVRPYLNNVALIQDDYKYEVIASTAFAILHPYSNIEGRFIFYYLRSNFFKDYAQINMKGVAYPAINEKTFFNSYFPLPPCEEQKRIVEKIEQLMLLCDQLEKQRDLKNKLQLQINSSAIEKLLQANDNVSLQNAWTFIYKKFDVLYTRKENITALKQTVLHLAISGKLGTNNVNDVPVSTLLKQIETERKQLLKEKKIINQKELLPITTNEKKYELPKGWEWVRYVEVAQLKHGHQFRDYDFVTNGIPVIKITQCKSDGTLDLSKCDFVDSSREKEFEEFKIYKDDLLMALTGGTLGKVTKVKNDYGVVLQNYRVGKFIANEVALFPNYLTIILTSDLFQSLVSSKVNQNAQPNIGKDNIENLPIPLPPLEEQERIVKKVEELFSLCNTLEKNIEQSSKKQTQILDAVLAQL